MFTGIIESLGVLENIENDGTNVHLTISSPISGELKIDQSVAHNGICLTVVKCDENAHTVTAIQETIDKTNLGSWVVGDLINLERCLKLGDRLDGHMVQGHVDTVAECISIENQDGSWVFTFRHADHPGFLTVEKGSICVNGTSLTVVNSKETEFSVAIIPYTYEHTNFHKLNIGSLVNLEFDILGKYIGKMLASRHTS